MNLTFASSWATFSVDADSRTIRGLAVPYEGAVASSLGQKWAFRQGSLDFSNAKVLIDHEGRAIGRVSEVNDTDKGAYVALAIARGTAGDELLQLAQDGIYDGLSIGLGDPSRIKATRDAQGVNQVTAAPVREVSVTPFPAFNGARVSSVAMSTTTAQEGSNMAETTDDTTPGGVEADVVSGTITGQVTITPPTDNTEPEAAALSQRGGGPVFSAAEISRLREMLATGGDARPVVHPGVGVQLSVNEPPVYRFDGHRGVHEFSSDIFAALRGDHEAHRRVDDFIAATFAAPVTSADATALNPNHYRPDLYVASDPVMTPVFDALYKGGLADSTPFVVPKFSAASDLVADHTEGTEPEGGDWEATSQTVTPTAVSGEVDLTREVVDAGGNPQVSGLIWTEINKAYDTAMETKAGALLTGSAAAELGTAIAAGDADAVLAQALTANLATLPFLSYGMAYGSTVLCHVDLYQALIAAKDDSGRPLFPINAPQNANGTSAERLQSVNVGGYRFVPAPSLGATATNSKSYAFDPSFGGIWASQAQRITLQPTVAYGAKIGVFGYVATAILNATRVAKITYTKA